MLLLSVNDIFHYYECCVRGRSPKWKEIKTGWERKYLMCDHSQSTKAATHDVKWVPVQDTSITFVLNNSSSVAGKSIIIDCYF